MFEAAALHSSGKRETQDIRLCLHVRGNSWRMLPAEETGTGQRVLQAVGPKRLGRGLRVNIYFTNWSEADRVALDEHGAFNVSLINDLSPFIDPFLLFASERRERRDQYDRMIACLRSLREQAVPGHVDILTPKDYLRRTRTGSTDPTWRRMSPGSCGLSQMSNSARRSICTYCAL
ncbi:hypothetical protein LCGC14_1649360 [marine sediment metagenome]|uniref:Uncharacterized protein n=1 Tax=marine sediment metagenome TaxID=412755 RepID=A0A0F9HY71_9ZZZZ